MKGLCLWVYKCNAEKGPHQSSWGDWNDFFSNPRDGRWGGSWGIKNPISLDILWHRMKPGDLVLAYQTDKQAAIGLCRLERFIDQYGEREMVLKPMERFARSVKLHALKKTNPALAQVRALRRGIIQTLYETSRGEARALLVACGASHQTERIGSPHRDGHLVAGGAFGSPENNARVEQAARRMVRQWYRQRGWKVRSVEREKLGYDLLCVKGSREEHAEVKGVSGRVESFLITAGEVRQAKKDPQFVLWG